MIRRSKPVQLLEWGQGTSQSNQNWTEFGKGKIVGDKKTAEGHRIITIQLSGACDKKNSRDESVKIAQEGEGMTPTPGKWGEVAFGRLKSVSGSTVEVEVKVAVKVGK